MSMFLFAKRAPLPIAIALLTSLVPVVGPANAQGNQSHPAHIHQGSCENLGDVVVPLDNVGTAEAGAIAGAASAIPVQVSETDVDLSLDDILAGEHAINIHESDDNIQTYIACGDIGGAVRGGTLLIGLASLNDSTYSGVAMLTENEAGGTTVSVFLTEGTGAGPADHSAATADDATGDDSADDDAADDSAAAATTAPAPTAVPAETAAPTEAAAAPAGQTIQVDIKDFAFSPNPLEINVGDTVVWTNQDGVPHTVTGQDRDLLQSGTLQPGATFSQTFTTAGEVAYFCEFHPNMNGTIIVK